jgi:hypothetical protein
LCIPSRHARTRGESAEAAAKTLADYTFKKAADGRHMSPFAYAAQANGHRFVGGKVRVCATDVMRPAQQDVQEIIPLQPCPVLQNNKSAAVLLHRCAIAGQVGTLRTVSSCCHSTADCFYAVSLQMDDITVVVSFISEPAGDSLNGSENGSSSSSVDSDGQLPELKPPPSKL